MAWCVRAGVSITSPLVDEYRGHVFFCLSTFVSFKDLCFVSPTVLLFMHNCFFRWTVFLLLPCVSFTSQVFFCFPHCVAFVSIFMYQGREWMACVRYGVMHAGRGFDYFAFCRWIAWTGVFCFSMCVSFKDLCFISPHCVCFAYITVSFGQMFLYVCFLQRLMFCFPHCVAFVSIFMYQRRERTAWVRSGVMRSGRGFDYFAFGRWISWTGVFCFSMFISFKDLCFVSPHCVALHR